MTGERMTARAAAAAERRCRAVAAEIAREARAQGIAAEVEAEGVRLSGRGLAKRWLDDPRLRFLGRVR